MRNALVFVLVMVPLLVACGKDKAGDQAGGSTSAKAGSPETVASVSGVEEEIPKIKAAIASPSPGDADLECAASMANIGGFENVEKHKALATELRQLCTKDLPLAKMKVAVETAEAARKAKPDEQVLSECYSADYTSAKDQLTKSGALESASALTARFAAACPSAK